VCGILHRGWGYNVNKSPLSKGPLHPPMAWGYTPPPPPYPPLYMTKCPKRGGQYLMLRKKIFWKKLSLLPVFMNMKEYVRDYIEIDGGRDGEGEELLRLVDDEFKNVVKVIIIRNSEFVDFSNIDICDFENLQIVNLHGTPNNFEEQDYPCFRKIGRFQFYERVKLKFHN